MRRVAIAPGTRFGMWSVVSDVSKIRGGHSKFKCRCECGNVREVYGSHLRRGNSKSCGCGRPSRKQHYKWTGHGEITGNHWNQIVRNANGQKGRPGVGLSITIEEAWSLFKAQDGCCKLTGRRLTFGINRTASLDRIDSKVGYHIYNVQWVHKDINRMKNRFDQQHFIDMCVDVAETWQKGKCEI